VINKFYTCRAYKKDKMTGTKTLTIIKPEAVAKEYTGSILANINDHGFHISTMKLITHTKKMAEDFYAVHGSDSDENANRECDIFFSLSERYSRFQF
jgi:nucleoside diphosphate kinase